MNLVAEAHLPTIYEMAETAEEGGFASYGPRLSDLFETMAQQIAQLFRGAKVADIPVELPTKFESRDQPQDRQSDRCDGSRGIVGAR